MDAKRVTVFTGHYGSGKTSLALAWSLSLREGGKRVALYDLDIVNPYFRSADHRAALEQMGVRLVVSPFAGSNLDVPALPAELYAAVGDHSSHAVLDVGGDDRGAVALGRLSPDIRAEGDYEMLFVANFCRPLTRTPVEALAVLREVEAACHLPATALVNNTNLGAETTARLVEGSFAPMAELARLSGLPVRFTGIARRFYGELKDAPTALLPMDDLEQILFK